MFDNAEVAADFHGKNIVSGGFFIFGMNLEAYFADGDKVYKGIFDQETSVWEIMPIEGGLPSADVLSINGQNQLVWDQWLQDHYLSLINAETPHNIRWFASMVSDIKRLGCRAVCLCIRLRTSKDMKTANCAWSMKPFRWRS